MKFPLLPFLNIECRIAPVMAAFLLTASHNAEPAWHDSHPGSGVAVHYVRLTGYGGDNEVNRKNLIETHKACADTQAAFGKLAKALPPEGVPAVISTQEIEIYYASNRTLTIKQGTLYDIDRGNCALIAIPHRILELRSAAGRCDIDLIKKEARGQCDAAAHERAAASSMTYAPSGKAPAVDLSKVPPQMRAQVEAQLERLKQMPRAQQDAPTAGIAATGQRKTLANTPCEVHRHEALQSMLCIATPAPSPERPLNPYPIPAAPLNGGIPGLLMAAKTPALTLQAQQVLLNLSVPRDLFAIPADVKINSGAGSQR